MEIGSPALTDPTRPLLLSTPDKFVAKYCELFSGRDHANFFAKPVDSKDAPCFVSIRCDKRGDDIDCFALARQKKVALLFVTQLTYLG